MFNLYFNPLLNQSKNINVDYHLCLSHSLDKLGKDRNSFNYNANLDILNNGLKNYVLFFGSLVNIDIDLIFKLKYVQKCKIIFWSTEDPFENTFAHKFMDHIDYYFTNDLGQLHQLSSKVNSFYLPLAACKVCGFNVKSLPSIKRTLFVGNVYGKRLDLFLSLPTNILEQIDFVGTGWPENFSISSNYLSQYQVIRLMSKYEKILDLQREHTLVYEPNNFRASTINPRIFIASAIGARIFSYGAIQNEGGLYPPDLIEFSDKTFDLIKFIDYPGSAFGEDDRQFLIKHTYDFNTFESRINKILNLIS
jgi:hypothetical protein